MRVPRRPRRRCGGGRSARGCGGGPVGTGGERMSSVTRDFAVGENPRRTRCRSRRGGRARGADTHVADALRPDGLVELDVHAHIRGLHGLLGELLHLLERERGGRGAGGGERKRDRMANASAWDRSETRRRRPEDGPTSASAPPRHSVNTEGITARRRRRTRDPRARPGGDDARRPSPRNFAAMGWHAPQPPHGEPSS